MPHSDGSDGHRAPLEDYERTRHETSEHEVVDAAEEVLGHAWVTELDRERRTAMVALEAAGEVVLAAHRLLNIAESEGDRAQVRSARALYAQAEQDLAQTLTATRATLSRADGQLRTIGEAGLARKRRRRSDTERLRSARRGMGEEAAD